MLYIYHNSTDSANCLNVMRYCKLFWLTEFEELLFTYIYIYISFTLWTWVQVSINVDDYIIINKMTKLLYYYIFKFNI